MRAPANYQATSKDVRSDKSASSNQLVAHGSASLEVFKFDDAISDFDRALTLNPKNAEALAARATAFVWKRDYESANRDLKAIAAIDPDNFVAHHARGLMAEQKGDCPTAVTEFSKALERDPDDNFALGHRATCALGVSPDAQALADSERALAKDPSWTRLNLLRAQVFAAEGKKEAAAREVESFASRLASNDVTLGAVAKIYAQLGLRDRAMENFNRAIAANPSPDLYVARAQARPLADYDGRIADLDAALKIDPKDSAAVSAKADLLTSRGQVDAALQTYDRALQSNQALSPLSVGRAMILYRLGRKVEAQKTLAAWRRGSGTAPEFNSLCSQEAMIEGLLASAVEDCGAALRIDRNYSPALDSLALVRLKQGKLDEAICAQ